MQLTLTPEIAAALIQAAQQQGTTPEILALSCLQRQFLPPPSPDAENPKLETSEQSLADFLDSYIGILASKTDNNGNTEPVAPPTSPFTQYLMQKRDQGKL
ncbi:MAG: hypothetical protein F6K30_20655 [Cyanothece sp. SIO2G6]|nr:hypothetical protein [Cyanothece sp. SIO2G6]